MKQLFSLTDSPTILNKDPLISTDHWGNIETLQELYIYIYIYIYVCINIYDIYYHWYILALSDLILIMEMLSFIRRINYLHLIIRWKLRISPVQCFISYNLSDKRYCKAKTLTRTRFRISSAQALVSQTLHFLQQF